MVNTATQTEAPLGRSSRFVLAAGAGGTILLFYLFAVASILFLLLLALAECVLFLVLLRFGLAGIMVNALYRHVPLIGMFIRSFRIKPPAQFHIPLTKGDAPLLFVRLENLCTRLEIPPPGVVHLEMDLGAWVELKGYRRGAGTTALGIGYDLMAGLSISEVEAVLAHEMVHAKLIQRGTSRLLKVGLARVSTLANALFQHVDMYRRAKRPVYVAQWFSKVADRLGRLCSWLVATYSRQNEFDADRGAAELCGADAIRSALTNLDELEYRAARLPWRERVAQLQAGHGFSQWLVKELTRRETTPAPRTEGATFNKYSTHPSMRDRLAALPAATRTQTAGDAPSAISLLKEPDAIAEEVVSEIQRVAVEQEEKDSRDLERWRRKGRRGSELRPLQGFGAIVGIAGVVVAVIVCCSATVTTGLIILAVALAAGISLYRLGRYKDRHDLPVPDFAVLDAGWKGAGNGTDITKAQDDIAAELRSRVAERRKSRDKQAFLVAECYDALGRCDYLRAHVAGRLCLEIRNDSIEGALGFAVAAAGLRQEPQVQEVMAFLQKTTGFSTPSTAWGAAWVSYLSGDWASAEAFLGHLRRTRPGEPTFPLLLASSRACRGKLQSAIVVAREACAQSPVKWEHAKLLIGMLLQAGYVREARERLESLEPGHRQDPEFMFFMVQLSLIQGKLEEAEQWTGLLRQSPASAHYLVRLGEVHESSRMDDQALEFYRKSLETAHFPEALLGMARIAANRRDTEEARKRLLAALDTRKTVGEGGAGALQLFHQIIARLRALHEPAPECRSWIATFSAEGVPAALANQSLIVCARNRTEAEQHLNLVVGAMVPDNPPLLPRVVTWKDAPSEQQPDGPVHPGVHAVIS